MKESLDSQLNKEGIPFKSGLTLNEQLVVAFITPLMCRGHILRYVFLAFDICIALLIYDYLNLTCEWGLFTKNILSNLC